MDKITKVDFMYALETARRIAYRMDDTLSGIAQSKDTMEEIIKEHKKFLQFLEEGLEISDE